MPFSSKKLEQQKKLHQLWVACNAPFQFLSSIAYFLQAVSDTFPRMRRWKYPNVQHLHLMCSPHQQLSQFLLGYHCHDLQKVLLHIWRGHNQVNCISHAHDKWGWWYFPKFHPVGSSARKFGNDIIRLAQVKTWQPLLWGTENLTSTSLRHSEKLHHFTYRDLRLYAHCLMAPLCLIAHLSVKLTFRPALAGRRGGGLVTKRL